MATTTNAPTTFDPNSFFQDYNEFNPNYTTDANSSQSQATLLQDALQYIQSNPTGMSPQDISYYTQQLQSDLNEQQNVTGYDTSLTGYNNATQQLANATGQAQSWANGNQGADTSSWGAIQQNAQGLANWLFANPAQLQQATQTADQQVSVTGAPSAFTLAAQSGAGALANYFATINTGQNPPITNSVLSTYYNQALIPQLQQSQATQNTAQTTADANLMSNITLTDPAYANELNAVNQYYYGNGTAQNPGQIQQTLQPELQSIYQQNYNQRNGINEQMAASGNLASGVRQQALGNQNSAAITAGAQNVANANSVAQTSLANLAQQNQGSQAQQQDLLNSLKQGGASSLLSGTTNAAIQNYDTNTDSQEQSAIQGAETGLAQNSANQNQASNILGTLGSGVGTLGGSAVGSNASDPFGMFAQNMGALV